MLKKLAISSLFLLASTTSALAQGTYMGQASTGEAVYYNGARAQCGDLPRSHPCYASPMVAYTIGNDHVSAIADCQRGVFKEVWVGSQLVTRNMAPQSQAIAAVLNTACNAI